MRLSAHSISTSMTGARYHRAASRQKAELARRAGIAPPHVERLLDLKYKTGFDAIEDALRAVGVPPPRGGCASRLMPLSAWEERGISRKLVWDALQAGRINRPLWPNRAY